MRLLKKWKLTRQKNDRLIGGDHIKILRDVPVINELPHGKRMGDGGKPVPPDYVEFSLARQAVCKAELLIQLQLEYLQSITISLMRKGKKLRTLTTILFFQ